nr:uncharacterized protein LOC128699704 [Cherax quadricarinatus]
MGPLAAAWFMMLLALAAASPRFTSQKQAALGDALPSHLASEGVASLRTVLQQRLHRPAQGPEDTLQSHKNVTASVWCLGSVSCDGCPCRQRGGRVPYRSFCRSHRHKCN